MLLVPHKVGCTSKDHLFLTKIYLNFCESYDGGYKIYTLFCSVQVEFSKFKRVNFNLLHLWFKKLHSLSSSYQKKFTLIPYLIVKFLDKNQDKILG